MDRDERLKKLLGLRVRIIIECTECKRKETQTDDNWLLILACEGNDRIEQALAQYFASERKGGIDCDSTTCRNKKVVKNYSRDVRRAPEFLCTQFNRYRQVITDGEVTMVKDERRVIYTSHLKLHPAKNGQIFRYKLLAAIHHWGTMDGGHYVTVTRTPAGNWVRHDNERVDVVGIQEALQPANDYTPYVLFWQKEPEASGTPETPKTPSKRRLSHDDQVTSEGSPSKRSQNENGSIWPVSWLSEFFGSDQHNPQGPPQSPSTAKKK